jgi:hypothetical protein
MSATTSASLSFTPRPSPRGPSRRSGGVEAPRPGRRGGLQGCHAKSSPSAESLKNKETKARRKQEEYDEVEATWREGGGLLDGADEESVVRTVRGTVQVAKHYDLLIEQQVFNLAKYGEGEVLPDTHKDPVWVAQRLCMLQKLTNVPPQYVPDMVEQSGAGVLALTPASVLRSMLAVKDLVPNGDASHMVRVEPDLLLVDTTHLAYSGGDVMRTLREMPLPEPCVRLLVTEEPGLLLGKGGLVRTEQLREQALEHRDNLKAICEGVPDDGWLDVRSQRWFTNFFCGYY